MSFWTDLVGGGDANLYTNPYSNGIHSDINYLENSNAGTLAAQNSTGKIQRRFLDQLQQFQNSPSFGHNAAVMSKLSDNAAEVADQGTVDANIAGLRETASMRAQAGQLGIAAANQDFAINQENLERQKSTSFGNSILGGLVQSAASAGAGALTGGLISGFTNKLFGDGGDSGPADGQPSNYNPSNSFMANHQGIPDMYSGTNPPWNFTR